MSGLPKDHQLGEVYRYSGGATGVILLIFGILGFLNQRAFFTADGKEIVGLSSNGALALISVVVGACLVGCAAIGGNTAAWANTVFGLAFLLSGLVNLTILRTDLNVLAFQMTHVIFSFVAGTALITFGMYGRVSGALPPDNPYWRQRHGLPAEVRDEEDLPVTAMRCAATDGARGDDPHTMSGVGTRTRAGRPAPVLSGGPVLSGAPDQPRHAAP